MKRGWNDGTVDLTEEWQFNPPVAGCNLDTGDSFNRIEELWAHEGCITYKCLADVPEVSSFPDMERLRRAQEGLVRNKMILFYKRESEDRDIINILIKHSVDGVAPRIEEVRNYYIRAQSGKGWNWYIKEAGLDIRTKSYGAR